MIAMKPEGLKPSYAFNVNEMSSKYDGMSTAVITKRLLELNTEFGEGMSYRVNVNEFEGDKLMYVLDFGNTDSITDTQMSDAADTCLKVTYDKISYIIKTETQFRGTVTIKPINPERTLFNTHCVAVVTVVIVSDRATRCRANETEMLHRFAQVYKQLIKEDNHLIYTGFSGPSFSSLFMDDYDYANS